MSSNSLSRVAAIVSAVAIPAFALSTPVRAQSTPATAAPPAETQSAAAAPALPKDIAAKVEQHIKSLHDQLKITAAEQPQWDSYAQVMRAGAARMNDAFQDRGEKLATMNAADNMDSYAKIAQTHASNMTQLAGAFQALYNSFPAQQKQLADNVFRMSDGRHLPGKKAATVR